MSERLEKIRKRHCQLWRLKQVLPVVYQFYQESPAKQMLEAIPLAARVPWICGADWSVLRVLFVAEAENQEDQRIGTTHDLDIASKAWVWFNLTPIIQPH